MKEIRYNEYEPHFCVEPQWLGATLELALAIVACAISLYILHVVGITHGPLWQDALLVLILIFPLALIYYRACVRIYPDGTIAIRKIVRFKPYAICDIIAISPKTIKLFYRDMVYHQITFKDGTTEMVNIHDIENFCKQIHIHNPHVHI